MSNYEIGSLLPANLSIVFIGIVAVDKIESYNADSFEVSSASIPIDGE